MGGSDIAVLAGRIADFAKRKGFCLVKGAYPLDFIERLESQLGNDPKGCIAACREHPATLAIVDALIGPRHGSIEADSVNFMPDPQAVTHHVHNDAPPYMPPKPDGTLLNMWKFAVYFRDYAVQSGGLSVVVGSHLREVPTVLTPIPSQPGDLVFWNFRTMHAGGTVRPGVKHAYPRNVIFFDFVELGPERDYLIHWIKVEKPKLKAMLDERRKREAASHAIDPVG